MFKDQAEAAELSSSNHASEFARAAKGHEEHVTKLAEEHESAIAALEQTRVDEINSHEERIAALTVANFSSLDALSHHHNQELDKLRAEMKVSASTLRQTEGELKDQAAEHARVLQAAHEHTMTNQVKARNDVIQTVNAEHAQAARLVEQRTEAVIAELDEAHRSAEAQSVRAKELCGEHLAQLNEKTENLDRVKAELQHLQSIHVTEIERAKGSVKALEFSEESSRQTHLMEVQQLITQIDSSEAAHSQTRDDHAAEIQTLKTDQEEALRKLTSEHLAKVEQMNSSTEQKQLELQQLVTDHEVALRAYEATSNEAIASCRSGHEQTVICMKIMHATELQEAERAHDLARDKYNTALDAMTRIHKEALQKIAYDREQQVSLHKFMASLGLVLFLFLFLFLFFFLSLSLSFSVSFSVSFSFYDF